MNNVDDEYTNLQQKYYDIQQKYNDMTNKIKCINEAKRKFDHLHLEAVIDDTWPFVKRNLPLENAATTNM